MYVCMPFCYFNLYEVWSMMMYVNHVGEMSRIMLVMLQKVVLRYSMCSVTIGSAWLDQVGWVVSSLICGGFVW